jgi:hypothetical protein
LQAADAIADQLHAEQQHQHGHDHGVVLPHPALDLVEQFARPVAHDEGDHDRDADADGDRRDHDEQRVRGNLPTGRAASPARVTHRKPPPPARAMTPAAGGWYGGRGGYSRAIIATASRSRST